MSLLKTFLGAAALNASDTADQDAVARRGEDMIRDQQVRNQDALIGLQQQHIDSLEARANRPSGTNLRELELEQKVKALELELEDALSSARRYKKLLSQPFEQIALESQDFKNNYQKEQCNLARRAVSEMSHKALAMQYATSLGLDETQVSKQCEEVSKMLVAGQPVQGYTVPPEVLSHLNADAAKQEELARKQDAADRIINELRQKRLARQNEGKA
jgi:hypothetical protein